MRILQVHNRYRTRGGEDAVVENEAELLHSAGHSVALHEAFNEEPNGAIAKVRASARLLVNREEQSRLAEAIKEFQPHIVHFHNTFMTMGSSVLSVPRRLGIPSCLTAHNYRVFCIAGTAFRDGRICTDCCGKSSLAGARHACYKGQKMQSMALAIATQFHSLRDTIDAVDLVVCLNPRQKDLLQQHGVRQEALHMKPNFVHEPPRRSKVSARTHFLFLGLLSPEKGIPVLIEAHRPDHLPLDIVGGGPLLHTLPETHSGIKVHGFLPEDELDNIWSRARFLVFPSVWLEGMPMVVLEALSRGVPVIAHEDSAGGQLAQESGGITYGKSLSLSKALAEASVMDSSTYLSSSMRARRTYESRFSTEAALPQLMAAYEKAIENHAGRP